MPPRFEFIAGSLALDWMDTLGGRLGEPVDKLSGPQDLQRWLAEAGLGEASPAPGAAELEQARRLRDAIGGLVSAVLEARRPDPDHIEVVNRNAARRRPGPRLSQDLTLTIGPLAVEDHLSRIAGDAVRLLAEAEDRLRLRECPGCGMAFVDRSRPGRRRWCASASGCGGKSRVARYRERRCDNPDQEARHD